MTIDISTLFGEEDPGHFNLMSVRLAVEDDKYRAVLHALGDAVRAACARIDYAAARSTTGDDCWLDAVVDDECDILENLIGAAFIVCQTQITAITERAHQAWQYAVTDLRSVAGPGPDKAALRRRGDPVPSAPDVSDIEAIWALANYFKHREEWNQKDWAKGRPQTKSTVTTIEKLRLDPRSTGNLRRGAVVLGNHSYTEVAAFADRIDAWGEAILRELTPVLAPTA